MSEAFKQEVNTEYLLKKGQVFQWGGGVTG